ncbi:acyltransferase family protein [Paractinoplanes brasiliensis]|uniref:Acyltransferase-like protein n=1 Tax=Paractinoplanes brasiliensis TaxID=52695 RepID=A0A4R6JP91_9ACTN|nr:acyltransferase family protein [Actinoplanes brasiliensis]TDO38089.1 acyltransferase-like protein [Actinoplanes brasiliensis]GID31180.1 membrane protein [Actinoplanes brasiliensis]
MRNRYLDLLRAVATVRVVVYHSTGWAALTIVFPAMSVMFALAGSMMAASLDRYGLFAVERRVHRLLPALWVLAAVAVPTMLAFGMAWDWQVLLWAFPLVDPPAEGYWLQALAATWYLRDFLWFVLLSPLLLPLFRRFPLTTLAFPYGALAVITVAGLTPPLIVRDLALYGGAWLLGFAHHDGLLARPRTTLPASGATALSGPGASRDRSESAPQALPAPTAAPARGAALARYRWWIVGVSGVTSAVWALTHPGPRGFDLNDIPLANALWSAAFILVVLGFAPRIAARRSLTVLNSRALTIYLWHVPLIIVVVRLAEATGLPVHGWVGISWRLAVVTALLGLVVMAVGWVEDISAGRRPALIPGRPRRTAPVSPAPAGASGLQPRRERSTSS